MSCCVCSRSLTSSRDAPGNAILSDVGAAIRISSGCRLLCALALLPTRIHHTQDERLLRVYSEQSARLFHASPRLCNFLISKKQNSKEATKARRRQEADFRQQIIITKLLYRTKQTKSKQKRKQRIEKNRKETGKKRKRNGIKSLSSLGFQIEGCH